MTLLSRRKRQITALNIQAAKATDAPYSSGLMPTLLVILFLVNNLPAAASDWAPRSTPIPAEVSKKSLSRKPSSDGWKSQHNKERTFPNRTSIPARSSRSPISDARQHVLRDPFGDREAIDTRQSKSGTRMAFTARNRTTAPGGSRQPVGQIGNSTFQFVKPGSAVASPPPDSRKIPRIKLTFAEPSEPKRPTEAMTVIDAASQLPREVVAEAFPGPITAPLAMARYEQSVLAVSEPVAENIKTEDTRDATASFAPENVNATESIIREEKKSSHDSGPSEAVAPVVEKKQGPPSLLAPTRERPIPAKQETPENKSGIQEENQDLDTEQTTDDALPSAADDLSRPEAPPFESLDLYSDEQLIERDAKAMQEEIDAAISAGKNAYERDCRASREYLLNRTLADISLNIAVAGVPGADFPVSCDIETHKIPLNSYRFGQQEPLNFAWTASGLCHKPLYFRELQAERYGHSIGRISQPFLSASHFFCNVAILPYNMGMRPPQECVYALGHYWPGDPAPRYIPAVPISLRGGLMQAGAVLGGAFILP